jgi:hypothetical protein
MSLRLLLLISASALAASGCAGFSAAECRGADWYDLGFRDAIYGLQPQDQVYAHGCDPQGVKVDQARYGQGWREGKWEADHRRNESIN